MSEKEKFINKAQTRPIDDFGSTSEDIFEVTINDLKEFKDDLVEDFVSGVLGGVEKAALKYIDSTFREDDVHRALINVINDSVRHKEFIQESRKYGIDLMNDVIKDATFLKNTKKLSLDVVKHDLVKKASIELLKKCLNHRTIQHFGKVLMRDSIAKTDAMDVLISVLGESVMKAVYKPETNGHLGKLFTRTLSIQEVQKEAINSLLYANLKQRMPFSKKSDSGSAFELSSALEQSIETWIHDRETL